jgi:predicted LPLAT superfamily acyltransferase
MPWREMREKGSVLGMFLTAWVYRAFGRWIAEPILWFVVGYYVLKDGNVRKASAQYLARVRSTVSWLDVYKHCLSFARTSLDRFDVWTRNMDAYVFHYHGEEYLTRQVREGKGAVLIGAHLGNFDTLHAMSKRHKAKVNILVDRRNAQKFSAILRRFCPGMDEGVVEYDVKSMDTVFELEQAVQRGEFVALLGDRVSAESVRGARRVSSASFLGAPALLPQSPFLFAAHMKCPVFLMFGLRRSAREYDLYVEPFADPLELPGESREEALARYIRAYAARLEHYCRLYPLQWFNFYDFWR